jgi:hypothetical protein
MLRHMRIGGPSGSVTLFMSYRGEAITMGISWSFQNMVGVEGEASLLYLREMKERAGRMSHANTVAETTS